MFYRREGNEPSPVERQGESGVRGQGVSSLIPSRNFLLVRTAWAPGGAGARLRRFTGCLVDGSVIWWGMKTPTLSSRVRRVVRVTVILLAVYTVVGFFVLPPIAKSQIQKRASATLGRQVTVERSA